MGALISTILQKLLGKSKHLRILMVGLDGAGKTTILYRLKLGQVIKTIPTIGFNVETLEYKNLWMTIWDVGGQDKLRRLWRHYYQNSHGIIFVVDSTDKERADIAGVEVKAILAENELQNCKLLVYANKHDLPEAMDVGELIEKLKLKEITEHKWYVQSTCALTGKGLTDGLEWLYNEIAVR